MSEERETGLSSRRWAVVIVLGVVFASSLLGSIAANFLFSAYHVPSDAMRPSIVGGDRVLARHISGRDARRGDIVVFRGLLSKPFLDASGTVRQGPTVESTRISRVIAIGGDRIDFVGGHVRINGKLLKESYLARGMTTAFLPSLIVPSGTVFLMGDNRTNSRDSRADGPVASNAILGRVDYINVPLDWIMLGLAAVSGIAFLGVLGSFVDVMPTNVGTTRPVRVPARGRTCTCGVARARREVEQTRRAPHIKKFGQFRTEIPPARSQPLSGVEIPIASITRSEPEGTLLRTHAPHSFVLWLLIAPMRRRRMFDRVSQQPLWDATP